jgi:chromate transporter
MGGRKLALLTMMVWALPVLFAMGFLSFGYQVLSSMNVSHSILRFIGPMAVGFIIIATVKIGRKVVTDLLSLGLLITSAAVSFFFRSPWVFPLILAAGGLTSILVKREKGMWNPVQVRPPWGYLVLFTVLALGGIIAATLSDFSLLENFERFYRYGYLVFGGGQVLVPVMYSELVDIRQFMTGGEFLTGYGLVQGLPGPMFSFAAYAGGMASRGEGVLIQALGAAVGGIGIFLPGLLLIYFVYPLWENLKQIRAIRLSLAGINAAAGGLIAVAAVILTLSNGISLENLTVTAASAVLLAFTNIPPPLIVLAAFALGVLL